MHIPLDKRFLFKLYLLTMRGESMRWLPLRRGIFSYLLDRSNVLGRRDIAGLEIHTNVYVEGWWNLELGQRVTINRDCVLLANGGLKIGDDSLIAHSCSIITTEHEYSGEEPIRDQPVTFHPVTIGRNVWLGARAIILGGSSIADGSIIGAGAVVKGKFEEPGSILAGIPARKIKNR